MALAFQFCLYKVKLIISPIYGLGISVLSLQRETTNFICYFAWQNSFPLLQRSIHWAKVTLVCEISEVGACRYLFENCCVVVVVAKNNCR